MKWVRSHSMVAGIKTLPKTSDERASELRIEIPGDPAHVRAVRLVAVDAAVRAGFDCDDADDLRIAVDEMCHTLLAGSSGPLSVRFDVAPGRVDVEVTAPQSESSPPFRLNWLSERIVRAVSDRFELLEGPSDLRFSLRKCATSGEVR
jgi:hypothetical protein